MSTQRPPCATCRWFTPPTKNPHFESQRNFGSCHSELATAAITTTWPGDGDLLVLPNFGCVHHEPVPES